MHVNTHFFLFACTSRSNRRHEAETTRSGDRPTGETTPTDLEAVGNLTHAVLTGKVTVEEACMSQELTRISERLDVKKQSIQASRTAKLWLQFMKMMDILRMFLKGERMGTWAFHMQALYEMMPYLSASGHNLYTKCIHVYLQQMHLRNPSRGVQTLRPRAPRCTQIRSVLCRTSPDLVSEQVLMRSMKTSEGLSRGRGMTETQRLVWLMAHPVCTEVNNSMQQLSGVQYSTREQHKDLPTARKGNI